MVSWNGSAEMVVRGRKGRKSKDGKGLTGYKGTSSSKADACFNIDLIFSFATIIFLLSVKMSPFREVAAINVTNVDLIEEFVFTAAFSTFDQVEG